MTLARRFPLRGFRRRAGFLAIRPIPATQLYRWPRTVRQGYHYKLAAHEPPTNQEGVKVVPRVGAPSGAEGREGACGRGRADADGCAVP